MPPDVGALLYELLDAHADTADLAANLVSEPRWSVKVVLFAFRPVFAYVVTFGPVVAICVHEFPFEERSTLKPSSL